MTLLQNIIEFPGINYLHEVKNYISCQTAIQNLTHKNKLLVSNIKSLIIA